MSKRLKKLKDASPVVRPNDGRSIPRNVASSNIFVISTSTTTLYKKFSFAFFSFFKYVTSLKSVKKLSVECKMRATKSDSVISAEKLEMLLLYGEN